MSVDLRILTLGMSGSRFGFRRVRLDIAKFYAAKHFTVSGLAHHLDDVHRSNSAR